jgi:hypothetical protein
MGMEKMSSSETRARAEQLAAEIGAHHISFNLDPVYEAQVQLLSENTGTEPKFKTAGKRLSPQRTFRSSAWCRVFAPNFLPCRDQDIKKESY